MASHRSSSQAAEDIGGEISEVAAANGVIAGIASVPVATPEWPGDDETLLGEMLRSHGFADKLVERLVELATAPTHVKRPVDRLAIALGAQFNFFALDDAWQAPILLCGLPGAGMSTLAAKLAARYDDGEILVISAGAHDGDKIALLADCLEVLDLPLTCAADAAALRHAVAGAAGRKVLIDAGGQAPLDGKRINEFVHAADASGILVMSGETSGADAMAAAKAASAVGIGRMIVTNFDVARYLGAALTAADTAKLALVGASVTPHFGFGMRTLTPENLARRLIDAALHAERWRVTPL
jgi:flagellar biosynthesis GTPase FlhF